VSYRNDSLRVNSDRVCFAGDVFNLTETIYSDALLEYSRPNLFDNPYRAIATPLRLFSNIEFFMQNEVVSRKIHIS
jgi:hypothetical protein